MYSYLLAGENLELASGELEGFLRSQRIDEEPELDGRVAFTEEEPSQLRRLALVHEVGEVLEEDFLEKDDASFTPGGSFRVRVRNFSDEELDTGEIESSAGEELSTGSNSIDLEDPEEDYRVYITGSGSYLVRIVEDIDRGLFEKRRNQERPFSSPVSLDPVLARVLVNLSGVEAGEHVLDPFCGTGGILIEAGLCGVGVNGIDIKEEMVEGCRENLEEYGVIVHSIVEGDYRDVESLFGQDFDAVITDLPYGRASKKEGLDAEEFLSAFEDEKTVFVSDREEFGGLEPEYSIYQHKNLTRHVYLI